MKKWQKMKFFRKAMKIALFSLECADIYLQKHHVEPSFNNHVQYTNGGLFRRY